MHLAPQDMNDPVRSMRSAIATWDVALREALAKWVVAKQEAEAAAHRGVHAEANAAYVCLAEATRALVRLVGLSETARSTGQTEQQVRALCAVTARRCHG